MAKKQFTPAWILTVAGAFTTVLGFGLLKISTPSPHGYIELFFAVPLILGGTGILGLGLLLLRTPIAIGLGLLILTFPGSLTISLLASLMEDTLDWQAPGVVQAAALVSSRWTGAVLEMFWDPSVEVQGGVYAWVENPRDARGRAVLHSATVIDGGVKPLSGARVEAWGRSQREAYRRCRDEGYTREACGRVYSRDRDTAEFESRYGAATYSLRLLATPSFVRASHPGCAPIDVEIPSDEESNPLLVSFVLKCESRE